MSQGKWLNNIARLIKTRDGKYFLKFARPTRKDGTPIGENPFPIVINEGDTLSAKLKKEDLQRLVDDGTMSQEVADKICETVKFEFSRPPQDGAAAGSKKQYKDEVPF